MIQIQASLSPAADLKAKLDNYVAELRNVRVIRMAFRRGLIAARLVGVAASTAAVLTFLDSHCECSKGEVKDYEGNRVCTQNRTLLMRAHGCVIHYQTTVDPA